ncbi:MAG: efflux RND transporter periplasmic adaptor subunit [Fluviicola sp.]
MNKRVIIGVVVGLVLVGLTVMKLLSNKEQVKEKIYVYDPNTAILVETSNPGMHTFDQTLNFLGTFEPAHQTMVGSDGNGKIVKLMVEEGDFVTQGQVIAKIDDELLQLQLESVDVSLEGQRNDDKRYDNLSKDNAVAGVTVEKTKLGLRSTEIQKKQIQKQLRNTTIKAPFSGVITKKMVDLGSVVGVGTPVVEITDIGQLKLTVSVPERDVLKFKRGQSVSVTADVYGDKMYEGKVTNISVVADRSHNFKVQITVTNKNRELLAGMYGSVRLTNTQSVNRLAIPRKALIGSSKAPRVYVVRNGKAKLVSFTAGTSDGDYVEVISGISAKDQIVVKGQVNLQDNVNVTVQK